MTDREVRAEGSSDGAVSATGTKAYQEEYRAHPTDTSGSTRRGLDIPATLAGMVAALGSLIILAGLLSAILGAVGYQVGLEGSRRSCP